MLSMNLSATAFALLLLQMLIFWLFLSLLLLFVDILSLVLLLLLPLLLLMLLLRFRSNLINDACDVFFPIALAPGWIEVLSIGAGTGINQIARSASRVSVTVGWMFRETFRITDFAVVC